MEVDVNVFHRASMEVVEMKNLSANLLDFGIYQRLVYEEKDGSEVTLDLYEQEVSLIRRGEVMTQALFSLKNESFLQVHNEHGTLSFRVEVEDIREKEDSLRILYVLYHENALVSKNEYLCQWNGGD